MNPFEALAEQGQSIWLDYIRRSMTRSGELGKLVDEGVRGMTSNPAIFKKAIGGSDDYDDVLEDLVGDQSKDASDLYEALALVDVQEAADAMRPVYDRTNKLDGYVSLEVMPSLARDTNGTIAQARRLWKAVARDNLMIKVPGTPEGLPAIETLLAEGVNVNVTLIFSRGAYQSIAEAFLAGAERWVESGGDPGRLASVASFFVSRIDSEVDGRLEALAEQAGGDRKAEIEGLTGKVAVANAKLAYEIYQRVIDSPRWKALADKGAQPQRLLWASTGTKNKAYSDVKYIEELVGPDTVNTVPPATLDAFRDHGTARNVITEDVQEARAVMQKLEDVGVSMGDVTDLLLERGVELFEDAMDDLLGTVAKLQRESRGTRLNRLEATLPSSLADSVGDAMVRWDSDGNTRRLWERDASLWTDCGEEKWLGWLDIVDRQRKNKEYFSELSTMLTGRGFEDVVLLGMGGSSLAPDVLAKVYGSAAGSPKLSVVDSTDPAQVAAVESSVELAKTLFIVSSKSGTTLEPNVLLAYFYDRAKAALGDDAPRHFVAITDPGSKLEQYARDEGFWTVQHGVPEIGGRFSAFSAFGMVPATAMGLPVIGFLEEAALMVGACGNAPARDNPGVELGVILGTAANQGRNKLTLVTTPAIAPVGAWLEQLVAESTGKLGKAIIPHEREPLLRASAYSSDRVFVYLRLRSTPHLDQDRAIAALADAGQPVVRIDLDDAWSLSQELFRWQVATAVAGAVMQLNPFDQPDVEASKVETRAMTDAYERSGSLPEETAVWSGEGVSLFTNDKNATALRNAVGENATLTDWLTAHVSRLRDRDYFALLGYIPMNAANERAMHDMRSMVVEATGAATCVGFGPRFLHSTGQAYKGGPNTGLFVQITCDDAADLQIPGKRYSFGVVKAAQARGDFEVLAQRGRRALRVHLHDLDSGLPKLVDAMETALARRAAGG